VLEESDRLPTAFQEYQDNKPSAGEGWKRAFEVLLKADYAKYGVTDGILIKGEKQRLCGALIRGWPGWCMAAVTRGWKLKLIILKENPWDKEIRAWFPEARVLEYGGTTLGDIASAGAEVWFCDMDPPNKLNLWVSQASYIIIATRRARNTVAPWRYQVINLVHSNCGGVTTGAWSLYVYSTPEASWFQPPPKVAGRDLSTILNTKNEGMPCAKPSCLPQLVREAIAIRPNTFHSGELLPWGSFQARVVAPCIFSKTGWVRRRLTGSEVLKALDVPDELSASLTSCQVKTVCNDIHLLPLKVAIAVIDSIPADTQLDEVQPTKRARLPDPAPFFTSIGPLTSLADTQTPTTHDAIAEDRNAKGYKNR